MQHCLEVIFCKTFHQTFHHKASTLTQIRAEVGPGEFFAEYEQWHSSHLAQKGHSLSQRLGKTVSLLLSLLLSVYFRGTPKVMECILMCSVAPTVTFKTCVNLEQSIYGNCRNTERNTSSH